MSEIDLKSKAMRTLFAEFNTMIDNRLSNYNLDPTKSAPAIQISQKITQNFDRFVDIHKEFVAARDESGPTLQELGRLGHRTFSPEETIIDENKHMADIGEIKPSSGL